jgi:hypothetical protein
MKIIINFIKHNKFKTLDDVKYVFVGNNDSSIIESYSNVIVCNKLRYNIENLGSKNVFSFEVGMLLKINRQLSLGTHVFSPVNVEVTNGNEINTRFRAGIKYSPSNKVFLLADLDKVLDRSLEFKFGFGYQPSQILEVRAGMNPTISQYTFGFRLSLKDKFKISSAFGLNNILGNTPALSIQYDN